MGKKPWEDVLECYKGSSYQLANLTFSKSQVYNFLYLNQLSNPITTDVIFINIQLAVKR